MISIQSPPIFHTSLWLWILRSVFPLSWIIVAYAMSFSHPRSPVKAVAICLLLLNLGLVILTPDILPKNTGIRTSAGISSFILVLRGLQVLYFREELRRQGSNNHNDKISGELERTGLSGSPSSKSLGQARALWNSLVVLLFNPREIGTPYAKPSTIPPFSYSDPSHVPSLFQFISIRILTAAVGYVLLDHLKNNYLDALGRDHPMISSANELILPALGSLYILRYRIAITTCFWLSAYLILHVPHDILRLLLVTATILKNKDFSNDAINLYIAMLPPLFGSPRVAWTIRRFWSRFWHQLLRSSLTLTANLIVNNLISSSPAPSASSFTRRARRRVRRYLHILVVFSLSGISHVCGAGISGTGAMWFFTMNAVGIMAEDAIQEIYRQLKVCPQVQIKISGSQWATSLPILERVLGFLWVTAWFIWVTPTWIFPILRTYVI